MPEQYDTAADYAHDRAQSAPTATPRTDDEAMPASQFGKDAPVVSRSFARTLEREVADRAALAGGAK